MKLSYNLLLSLVFALILIAGCSEKLGTATVPNPDKSLVSDCKYQKINTLQNVTIEKEGTVLGWIGCENAGLDYHYEYVVRNGNPVWEKANGHFYFNVTTQYPATPTPDKKMRRVVI